MSLKNKLELHFHSFDRSKLSPDPLEIPHQYYKPEDIEIIAFISALFAFGNVKSIIQILNQITDILGENPYQTFTSGNKKELKKKFENIYYRFYSSADIQILMLAIQSIIKKHSSLKKLFMQFYNDSEPTLKKPIAGLMNSFLTEAEKINGNLSYGLNYMFPDPLKGSACKRINLFLRWMVRKDTLDFGLWNEIPPAKLVIPVDTHIARISKKLGLTKKKNVSWSMAEEITGNLRKFDSTDPVKYDFALCHIGMRKMKF